MKSGEDETKAQRGDRHLLPLLGGGRGRGASALPAAIRPPPEREGGGAEGTREGAFDGRVGRDHRRSSPWRHPARGGGCGSVDRFGWAPAPAMREDEAAGADRRAVWPPGGARSNGGAGGAGARYSRRFRQGAHPRLQRRHHLGLEPGMALQPGGVAPAGMRGGQETGQIGAPRRHRPGQRPRAPGGRDRRPGRRTRPAASVPASADGRGCGRATAARIPGRGGRSPPRGSVPG